MTFQKNHTYNIYISTQKYKYILLFIVLFITNFFIELGSV